MQHDAVVCGNRAAVAVAVEVGVVWPLLESWRLGGGVGDVLDNRGTKANDKRS